MAVEACADAQPVRSRLHLLGQGGGLDATLRQAFDEAIAANPDIKVVAEGESFYTTPLGLQAAQDMLAAHPDST